MFAKHWEPGKVKTRLARTCGESRAAAFHRRFVVTLARRFKTTADGRVLAYWPPDSVSSFTSAIPPEWNLQAQSAGDLGERMRQFFIAALAAAQRVVLIGSDSPDLPPEYVIQALNALRSCDVVLGRSADGGYYLLGLARRLPPIFDGVAWSTPEVWPQTIARLRDAGIAWHELPPWYDVDDEQGLLGLIERLSARPPADPHLCELKNWISELLGLVCPGGDS
jgi:rSAM/selenodomain-associated transferase 1